MGSFRKATLEMHTLLRCAHIQFTGITRNVLNQLHVTPKIVGTCDAAMALIQEHEFDVIIVDWREIDNLGEFLRAVRDHDRSARPAAGVCGGGALSDSQTGVGGAD